jgi:hypothetical protein
MHLSEGLNVRPRFSINSASSTVHQIRVLSGIPHSHIVLERFTRSSGLSFRYFWRLYDEVEGGNVTTFQHDTPQSPHMVEELALQQMSR